MITNQNNRVSGVVSKFKKRFGLSMLNRRLAAGLSILIAILVLTIVFYNFVWVV
ncbi:hypothetical protein KKI24_12810 [bacterium]|nr:hypothetical protein [bacterium]